MPDALLQPGRHGNPDGTPGVFVALVETRALATVVAGRNRADALADALEARFGVRPPPRPAHAGTGGTAFVGVGPGRWLALDEAGDGAAFEAALRDAAAGQGAVTDQSDALVLVRLWGRDVRAALAKGVAIDLHPALFRTGDAATTLVAHVGATLWQTDDAPVYEIAVGRSFAAGFLDGLADAAAAFGLQVEPADRG